MPSDSRLAGHIQQLETKIDADTHIRREHDGNVFGVLGNPRALRRRESRGADHRTPAGGAADVDVLGARIGKGEIDQHIEVTADGFQ